MACDSAPYIGKGGSKLLEFHPYVYWIGRTTVLMLELIEGTILRNSKSKLNIFLLDDEM